MKVAVIGAGTLGVQTLLGLAERGVQAVGFERFAPGHGRGSAGGDSRLFSTVETRDLRYTPVIRRAEELWDELNLRTGLPLISHTGAVMIGNPEDAEMRTALEAAGGFEQAPRIDPEEFAQRFPQLRLASGDVAVLDPRGGKIQPELAVTAIARLARLAGAEIREHTRVIAIEPRGEGVRVRTDAGWESFDRAIIAAGAWTPQLLGGATPDLAVRRLTSVWHFPRVAGGFDQLLPFIRIAPGYIYGLPSNDALSVKLGLGFEHHLPVTNPDVVSRWAQPEELGVFRERIDEYLPGFTPNPYRVETYFETYSPTKREYFSPVDGMPGALLLAGFSGHGFKVSPAIGEAAADWAVDAEPQIPVEVLLGGDQV